MESHYEINVSHNGQHFFATAPRSCTTKEEAKKVFISLSALYPSKEGFKVTCSYYECHGRSVTF